MRMTVMLGAAVILTGCASTMSGLDGEAKFSCKAPDGVTCASLSGVYANAVANNLPSLRKDQARGEAETETRQRAEDRPLITGKAPDSGMPIRSAPRVLRIWIAPFEDSEGDLHDQSYIYVVADPGRWLIEHNQKRIASRYQPTFVRPQSNETAQKKPASAQPSGGMSLPGTQTHSQQSGD